MANHEEFYNLMKKYQTKDAYIIKRKTSKLDFSLCEGSTTFGLRITINSNTLTANSYSVSILSIKTIYLTIQNSRYGTYCYLNIVKLDDSPVTNVNDSKVINVRFDNVTNTDAKKLYELFEYFVFSNEKNIEKLISNEYKPLINNKYLSYDFTLNKYEDTSPIQDEVLEKNGVVYTLYEIIPKENYKFYNHSNRLFYESKYLNQNYMDVWIERKKYTEWTNVRNSITNILNFFYCIVMLSGFILAFIAAFIVDINVDAYIHIFVITLIAFVILRIIWYFICELLYKLWK